MAAKPKVRVASVAKLVYGDEPSYSSFIPLTQKELVRYLNWANKNFDKKQKAGFCYKLVKDHNLSVDLKKLKTVSDDWLGTIGAICKLQLNGCIVEYDTSQRLNEIINLRSVDKPETIERPAIKPKKDSPNLDDAYEYCDQMIDNIILKKEHLLKSDSTFADKLNRTERLDLKRYLECMVSEYSDKELLKDGYNMSEGIIKKLLKTIDTFIILLKPNVTTRAKKVMTPSDTVKNLKFLDKSDEYGLKSIKPERILGKTKLIVFNNKTRRIGIYYASSSEGLGIKGTTITGYNESKSVMKTDRKPKEATAAIIQMANKASSIAFGKIKSVEQKLSGRINKDILLLKVY